MRRRALSCASPVLPMTADLPCGCVCPIAWPVIMANTWFIEGVKFAYGHEQVLAALQSDTEYAEYRRQHGEEGGPGHLLGQAMSYRFKRDGRGWRVFAATRMMDVPVVTDQRRGAIGVDLNADHLAVAETDASGNCLRAWRVPLVTYGRSSRQAEALNRRRGGQRGWLRT